MCIMYARVWMRLIRIESELAGFAFNALLNLHSCRQALGFIGLAIQASFHVNGFGADSHARTTNNQLIKLKTTIDIALV